MTITRTTGATALAFAVMLGAAATAVGQDTDEMPQGMGPGMMGHMPEIMGHRGPGMMGPGMGQGYGPGPGMMGQGMMGQGYGPGPGMMGPGMMGPGMGQGYGPGPGMMGPGMMGQGYGQGYGPGPGMMGQGMMSQGYGQGPGMMGQMGPGMGESFGSGPMAPGMMGQGLHRLRVVPTVELSTDDVRRFLERHISAHGLTRLQVGEVTQSDDETITADIVTREGSLALRLEIDAYTGFVKSVS